MCHCNRRLLYWCTTHCDRSNSEGDHVRGGGDGDGDAGVLHRLADPLLERDLLGGLVSRLEQVVPTLHYDEHVVDADACKDLHQGWGNVPHLGN